jgi:hypothetical protein
LKNGASPFTISDALVTSKEDTMTVRSLALGGITTLLMTLSAAAEAAPPTHFAPLQFVQQVVQRDWRYYYCQTDDGNGRHRPCDANFKRKHRK